MRVSKLKTQGRRTDQFRVSELILDYGERNDYPEKIHDCVMASATGKGCLDIATRFTFGNGFADKTLSNHIVNRINQSANFIAKKCCRDYKEFGGFFLHVNYNALLEISEIQHIPFLHGRLGITRQKELSNQIAVHPNWTNRPGLKSFKRDDIITFPVFNPIQEVILAELPESGIENYSGQVLFFSSDGEMVYPLSPFDPVVTDMSTEESISTVLHRNAKYNFLPAGMVVRKSKRVTTTDGNKEREEPDTLADEVTEWQGDERAAKIIVVDVEFEEEIPSFVPFNVQNFDRMFNKTSEYVEEKIGKIFMQPPILRGVDVGAGFGADLMKNAYDFYNSIIEPDRKTIESVLKKILERMPQKFTNYDLSPLTFQSQATNEGTRQ